MLKFNNNYLWLLLLPTFLIIFLIFNFNSNSSIREKDLEKYSWLLPFIERNNDLEGFLNNDSGVLKFSYEYFTSKEKVMQNFDTIASEQKWKLISSDRFSRQYSKFIPIYPAKVEDVIITIDLDTLNNKVLFVVD